MTDITITSLDTITAFSVPEGNYLFTLDELQSVTVAQGQEVTEITGKQGRKLSSLKRNKSVTISGTNGMLSCGLLEMQTGVQFDHTATKVQWADYLTVENNTATTSYIAVGTAGAEIEALYIKNSDHTLGDKLVQDSTASAGKFAYNPATKTLTFSGVAGGTEIVVYYKRRIMADVLTNLSDTYSGKAMLYIDATGEDKCANIYHLQIFVPKADFNGQFSLEFGDNQSVHAFEAEALTGACGTAGEFFTYTVFGEKTTGDYILSNISVTQAPSDVAYSVGETFDPTGMVVKATYTDNSSRVITDYTYTPDTALAQTDTTVTISYEEDGVTKTTTQAITVTA